MTATTDTTPANAEQALAIRDALTRMWLLGSCAGEVAQVRGCKVDLEHLRRDLADEMLALAAHGIAAPAAARAAEGAGT